MSRQYVFFTILDTRSTDLKPKEELRASKLFSGGQKWHSQFFLTKASGDGGVMGRYRLALNLEAVRDSFMSGSAFPSSRQVLYPCLERHHRRK